MRSRAIRSSFLDYFRTNDHTVVPSSPLVPHDDPTLLFTNAGMNQFKDVFLGKETRHYTRAASAQKCMRVSGKHNDLDNVGPSLRHHTFFEMLGNFSFGDYFKREAIPFAWTLLTDVWRLPADRLVPTIFAGDAAIPRDDEAFEAWRALVPAERIGELGAADNFWAMGETGPCGRCSEIYYFRGNEVPCNEPVCRGLECSCDRYIEIWNNVFMEFDRQPDGTLNPLPARSIDTGMGLERVTAVIQGTLSNYDTDLFRPIIDAIAAKAGRQYASSAQRADDISMRVIADHLRAMTFLISDGVVPSNEWRGYVLRKIMRRAMRHGKKLGFAQPVLHDLVEVVIGEMSDAYPDLTVNRDSIVRVVRSEEERFDAVLTAGLPRLEDVLDRAATGNRIVPGDDAFRLYDSLGVPYDFMEDLAGHRGLTIDRDGYERAMQGQRVKARAGSAFKGADKDLQFVLTPELEQALGSAGDRFEGYESTCVSGVPVLALFDERGQPISDLPAGARGYVAIARTPFYVEAGGQVSDSGRLIGATSEATVERMVRQPNKPRLHQVRVDKGALRTGEIVTAEVADATRDATRRNHTATHLLHAALRSVLGPHVKQAGSFVAPDRLRFDFAHFSPIPREQLEEVERRVNAEIVRNTAVTTEVRSTEEAMAAGAMALFGEKYGDRVRVVSIAGFSMELCGGTHVRATGDIGALVITEESGVAAGVRRIEALTGAGAVEWMQRQRDTLSRVVGALGTTAAQAPETAQKLQADAKRLARDVEQLKMKVALGGGSRDAEGNEDAQTIDGVKLITRKVSGLEKNALRGMSDTLRDRLGSGVVVIASENDGRVSLVVSVSKDLTARVKAGNLVKELAPIVGGTGGGRPDFAEAGGKDPSKIDALLAAAPDALRKALTQNS
ncbi:MAG: alanine--tRNA ligase [Acidobacteria bacterium]|nr:alanine--tRNA ligase [Acidobacteriota bacterium]